MKALQSSPDTAEPNIGRLAGRRHPSESLKDRDGLEAELDEALRGTFPASDSPSLTSSIISGGPPLRDRL